MTTIALIDNQGPNSVAAALTHLSKKAKELDVQAAFVTTSGVKAVLTALKRVATSGRVRVLTGLYQGFTEPSALRMLLAARKASGNRIEVRLSREKNFHRKVYGAATGSTIQVIVGSSNLTDNGLMSAGELSVWMKVPATSSNGKALRKDLRETWQEGAVLTASMIDTYEAARVPPTFKTLGASKLAAIIGKAVHHEANPADEPRPEARHWLEGTHGYVGAATETAVSAATSWDRPGWSWQACDKGYARDDEMLLVDSTAKTTWLWMMRVRGEVGPLQTPDGRYFVAYSRIPKLKKRKLTKQLRAELKAAGVPKLDGTRRRLSAACWARVVDLFR